MSTLKTINLKHPDGTANTIQMNTSSDLIINGAGSGNVGIGTSSPTVPLQVNGSGIYLAGIESSTAYAFMGLKDSNSSGTIADPQVGVGVQTNDLLFRAGGAERARIDSSGHLDLTNGGGNIKMANGAGIDFSATSNITGTSSELLDDYEEGTFTPHISDDSGGSTTAQAYGYNDGWYTKIGKLVYFHIDLRNINSSNLTGTNTLYITGLPFTSLTTSVGGQLAVSMVPGNALSWSGYTQLFPTIVNGTDYLIIRMSSSGTTSPATMLISNINGGTNRDMWLSGTYRID